MALLRALWLERYEAEARSAVKEPTATTQSLLRQLLYLLQQFINAVPLSCIYGLLAIGYTLVYGIIGRINLAFGEVAMVGAYATFMGISLFVTAGGTGLALALIAVLLMAMAVGVVQGWIAERIVFRPLRRAATQAPLIASIGLAIFFQEYMRLTQGSRDRYLQPVFSEPYQLAATADFSVTMTLLQILIAALTLIVYALLWVLMQRSAFGRAHRACADDAAMAALCGVDVNRTVVCSFMLGAAYAAIAGFVMALYYGVVNFHMGYLIGFKALVAAIVGGIGSVSGAMMGGILIGMLEVFWSSYLPIAYRDIAVFGLLALFLVFRPHGVRGVSSDQYVVRLGNR